MSERFLISRPMLDTPTGVRPHAVVIGAGITGGLVAWRLQRAGWQVAVLEAAYVGAGSSSRTAAGIRQQFSTPETVVGMRFAVDFYRRFPEIVGGTDVPIVQNGYLFLHAREEPWQVAQARVRMQVGCGLTEAVALDQRELVKRFPWVEPHAVLGGTFCPTDGFLRPETVYNESIAAARRLGATVHVGAPVIAATRVGDRITSVRTTAAEYAADLVIDCTNAFDAALQGQLGFTELPIAPLKRYLWFIQRDGTVFSGPDGERAFAAMPLVVAPSGAYCRPENTDSLLCGWAHDALPEPGFTHEDQDRIEPAFFHKTGPDSLGFEAWATLAEVIPGIGEFGGITATTSGYYATTPDHNPFLDRDPAFSNVIRAVGFSGHGAMFGPFSALVVEALATQGRPDRIEVLDREIPLHAFRIGRDFGHEAMVI